VGQIGGYQGVTLEKCEKCSIGLMDERWHTGAKPVRPWVLLRPDMSCPCAPSKCSSDSKAVAVLIDLLRGRSGIMIVEMTGMKGFLEWIACHVDCSVLRQSLYICPFDS
jgi:hypothetical protein